MWWVSESELATYEKTKVKRIKSYSDKIKGLGAICQHVIDNTNGWIFVLDDTIEYVSVNVGRECRKIEDHEAIYQIIENCAYCASEAGTCYFGFSNSSNIRRHKSNDPFAFTGWIGSALGFVSRYLRFDRGFFGRAEVAFSLAVLHASRFFWADNRFAFIRGKHSEAWSVSVDRDADSGNDESKRLAKEWGGYIKFVRDRRTQRIILDVCRRQNVTL